MGVKRMSRWDRYWMRKVYPDIDDFYVQEARNTWGCGPVKDLNDLADWLRIVYIDLEKASYVVDFDRYSEHILKFKEGVDAVTDSLSGLSEVCDHIATIIKINDGVSALSRIGNIRNDPEGAAKAFGKVLSGIGELAHFLPYPASDYVGILQGAVDFFVTVRRQMQPEVHMREPGIRETIENL
jgi:hypothetical protein